MLRVQIVVLSSECCNPASNGFLCNPNQCCNPSPPFDCKPKHECNMLPGFILAAPSLLLLSLSFFLLASSFFVSSLIETYGNFSLYVCVCVGGWQLCTQALLINKQVLFDFITLSRAFLGSCAFTMNIYASRNGNVAHKLQEASSQSAKRQQQLSTDAPVAQNSNSWSYWGCRWAAEGEGEGERGENVAPTVSLLCCL